MVFGFQIHNKGFKALKFGSISVLDKRSLLLGNNVVVFYFTFIDLDGFVDFRLPEGDLARVL